MHKAIVPIFFVLLIFWFGCGVVNAQDNLQKDRRLFKKHIKVYSAWLDTTGLSQLIQFDHMKIGKDRLVVFLKNHVDYQNPDQLSGAWVGICNAFKDVSTLPLERILLQKLSHVMGLSPQKVQIIIKGTNPALFKIQIRYVDNKFTINDNIGNVRGTGDKVAFNVEEVAAISIPKQDTPIRDLTVIKRNLMDSLQNFYKKVDTKCGNDPRIVVLQSSQLEFTLLITHITNEIITTYFELIELTVHVEEKQDEFRISYVIFPKFSSGICDPPAVTSPDYESMDLDYNREVKMYRKLLGPRIQNMITSK